MFSLVRALIIGMCLGWYLALFTVILVVSEPVFNEAFPNPWRLLICVPSLVALLTWWTSQ